jgi:hypothetical protein
MLAGLGRDGRFPASVFGVGLVRLGHNSVFEKLDLGRQIIVVGCAGPAILCHPIGWFPW